MNDDDSDDDGEGEDDDEASAANKNQRRTDELKRRRRHKHKTMWYQQRLWVDKHAPSFVSHLLSVERTNHEVLRALRAWDPYVFERDAPARPVSAYHSGYDGGEGRNDNNKNSDGGRDASEKVTAESTSVRTNRQSV